MGKRRVGRPMTDFSVYYNKNIRETTEVSIIQVKQCVKTTLQDEDLFQEAWFAQGRRRRKASWRRLKLAIWNAIKQQNKWDFKRISNNPCPAPGNPYEPENRDLIRQILVRLNTVNFRIFVLFLQGYKLREIGETEGVTAQAIEYRIRQIRELAKELNK